MTVLTQHTGNTINAISAGIASSRTGEPQVGSQPIRDRNTAIAQKLASEGWSLYFPAGEYEFNDAIRWTSRNSVSVWGEESKIYQMGNTRLFEFQLCTGVKAEGLHMHTQYFDSRTANADDDDQSVLWFDRCALVDAIFNTVEGFNTYAIFFFGGDWLNVSHNKFKDGHWWSDFAGTNYQQTGDIRFEPVGQTSTDSANSITVIGNQCCTESLLGITSQRPTRNLVCTGNVVVSRDENGNEVTTYHQFGRKSCIELQYYTDDNVEPNDEDSTRYHMTIADNICHGARYGGISHQSSSLLNTNEGGIRGTISGNEIRHCALEQASGITDYVVGGIVINQYRDVTITGNTIKEIKNDLTTSAGIGSAAMFLMNTSQRASNDPGPPADTLSSMTVTGNIITDCDSRGIYLRQPGDLTMTGNILRDVRDQNLTSVVPAPTAKLPRLGKHTIMANRLVSEQDMTTDAIRIESGSNTSEFIFSGNTVDFSGNNNGTTLVNLFGTKMSVIGNRIKGELTSTTGINLGTTQDIRASDSVLADNHFADLGVAIRGSAANSRGPWVLSNSSFANVTTRIANDNYIWPGSWNDGKIVAYGNLPSGAPTQGNWLAGDMIFNNQSTSGSDASGWVCIADGQPGTWVEFGKQQEAQLLDAGGSFPQTIVSGVPEPIESFDLSLATAGLTADPANARITLPDTPAGGQRWKLHFSATFTGASNNSVVSIWVYVNGVPTSTPLTSVSIQNTNNSQSIATPSLFFDLGGGLTAPEIEVWVESSATGDITWELAQFGLEYVRDL